MLSRFSRFPARLAAQSAVAATLAVAVPCSAAEIRSVTAPSGGTGLVLAGIIAPGDDAKLAAALATVPRPRRLSLESLGGNVQAALALGETVRREGLATTVPARGVCASACGLVWLAGTPRAMGPDAHVGLHAAYLRRNGVSVETGAANALIGAYLGRLGFDDKAIVYLTSAAPEEMTWILPADRQRYGIAYEAAGSTTVAALPTTEERFLSRPMAIYGAIASAAVAAVDRLLGHPAGPSAPNQTEGSASVWCDSVHRLEAGGRLIQTDVPSLWVGPLARVFASTTAWRARRDLLPGQGVGGAQCLRDPHRCRTRPIMLPTFPAAMSPASRCRDAPPWGPAQPRGWA